MKIKVLGKQHLQGTSKRTGNDYNFLQIHYTGPARGVEGVAAKTLNLDPVTFPPYSVLVGTEYLVEFDERGNVVDFVPATAGK